MKKKKKSLEELLREILDERFHPVEREVAALVSTLRYRDQAYDNIGKGVAKLEHFVDEFEETVRDMRKRADAIMRKHQGPEPAAKKGSKVVPFKRKPRGPKPL